MSDRMRRTKIAKIIVLNTQRRLETPAGDTSIARVCVCMWESVCVCVTFG